RLRRCNCRVSPRMDDHAGGFQRIVRRARNRGSIVFGGHADCCCRSPAVAAMQPSGRAYPGAGVTQFKLLFGGFGRCGLEAIGAALILTLTNAIVACGLMIITASNDALSQAEQTDRPELIQIKGRFNRALFETPRRGYLPPLTLPVYESLIDLEKLVPAGSG